MIPFKVNSGQIIDLSSFCEAHVNIFDIAAQLSKVNRYTGATKWPYSVAQHSFYLSHMAPHLHFNSDARNEDVMCLAQAALLHDAHEAYINDTSTPMKELIQLRTGIDWNRYIELPFQTVIFSAFNVPMPWLNVVHKYDTLICVDEFRQCFLDGQVPDGLKRFEEAAPGLIIKPWTSAEAESMFLNRFRELFSEERKIIDA